jgi:hypothetical protein
VLLGVPSGGLSAIEWGLHGTAFYRALFAGLRPFVWPFVVGNTTLGVLAGATAYFGLRKVLERRSATP